jgi:uncharacterized cofD-like protein
MDLEAKNIVTIGGGTGNFTVLSGLKDYGHNLSAVVSMADDGGSTGVLRTELGVLPPGDVRQCLVALSRSSALLCELFTYRFESGRLEGANFGNLFLSAMEKITGDFDAAVQRTGEVLRIRGQVIPVTTESVALKAVLPGLTVVGQDRINETVLPREAALSLEPVPRANPRALRAIADADLIVIGPGDLYSSIIPNLLVGGISEAIRGSAAKKAYVANLMTKPNHTDGFHVADYVGVVERYLGGRTIDAVIYNTVAPTEEMIARYAHDGEHPVRTDAVGFVGAGYQTIGAPVVADDVAFVPSAHDPLPRTLIRHDPAKLAKILLENCLSDPVMNSPEA